LVRRIRLAFHADHSLYTVYVYPENNDGRKGETSAAVSAAVESDVGTSTKAPCADDLISASRTLKSHTESLPMGLPLLR